MILTPCSALSLARASPFLPTRAGCSLLGTGTSRTMPSSSPLPPAPSRAAAAAARSDRTRAAARHPGRSDRTDAGR